nr:PAS domain S-box protein [Desulfogranum japonicum]
MTQFSFNHAEMGIFRVAADASILDVNHKAAELLGYTREELVTKRVVDIDFDLDEERWQVLWDELSPGQKRHFQTTFVKKDGTRIVVEIFSNRLEYEGKRYSIIFIQDITQRKQAEDSLKLTQFCFDKASIGIFRIGEQGEILEANEEARQSLGYTEKEISEVNLFTFNPTLSPDLWEASKELLHEQGVITGESIHKRKNGEEFQVDVIINMISFGGQDFYVLFCQNITQRKEAENKLRENQRLLNYILESMNEGVLVLDQKFRYTVFNKNMEMMSGTSREDILGKTPWEVFAFVRESESEKQIRKTMRGEVTETVERRLPTGSGRMGWFSESFSPVKDDDNCIIGVVGVVSDISRRKQDEHELRSLRNYLSNIIDSMPSTLIGVDEMGRVTQWNKTAERHTGIEADIARGRMLPEVLPYMSLEMEKIYTSITQRQIIHEQKRPGFLGGSEGYEELTIYPLIANGVEGAVIRVDDVSEHIRLEEMMIQSEKMLSVGGLAAGMAHEINNPLAGIMQTAEVMSNRLRRGVPISANTRAAEAAGTTMESIEQFMDARGIYRMLDTINESGRRVASIVANMLSFARKGESIVTYSDLEELIEKTLELAATDYDLKKQYDFKQIAIHKDFKDSPLHIPCEQSKIQQVLLNIFRNAAQAMQEAGTPSPSLGIHTYRDKKKKMACVEITDNGPGMDEITRKRVFEPFFTTKQVGTGTGLGLSVSYFIIVENHGGTLSVDSSPGKGSTFVIRLPLQR